MNKTQMIVPFALLYLLSLAALLWLFKYEQGMRCLTYALGVFLSVLAVEAILAPIRGISPLGIGDYIGRRKMWVDSPMQNIYLNVIIAVFVSAIPLTWFFLTAFKKWSMVGVSLLISLLVNGTFLLIVFWYYRR